MVAYIRIWCGPKGVLVADSANVKLWTCVSGDVTAGACRVKVNSTISPASTVPEASPPGRDGDAQLPASKRMLGASNGSEVATKTFSAVHGSEPVLTKGRLTSAFSPEAIVTRNGRVGDA